MADLAADFLADFSAELLADFLVDFCADSSADSSADASADFSAEFSVDFVFPHKFSLLVCSLLFSGCAGLTRESHPLNPPDFGVAGKLATMPTLRGMLVC